jgi:hypothetical protein
MLEEDEEDRLHGTKRFFQVPTLEECLGKDNLQRRREEEAEAFIRGVCANGGGITDYVSVEEIGSNVGGEGNKISTDVIGKEKMQVGTATVQQMEEVEKMEATGPGAAGTLSGADDGAWQEPC